MSTPLKGCAFVTGGSRGIGAAIARRLSEAGWPIAIGFRKNASAAEYLAHTLADPRDVRCVQCDVTSETDVESAFSELEATYGRVAVLVNNAGFHKDGLTVGLQDTDWERVIDVNLTGAFRTSRRAVGPMVRARHGRIISITSILAHQALPGTTNYAAAKSGLTGLMRVMATELAPRGITVNAVAPGLVRTEMVTDVGHFENSARREVPMGRAVSVDDIASGVAFLASEQASYITGHTLTIDGGPSASAFNISA